MLRECACGAFVKPVLLVGCALADGCVDGVGRSADHAEHKGDDAVAPLRGLQVGGEGASLTIRVACEGERFPLDDGAGDGVVVGREDVQHECYEAISSCRVLQLLRVGARRGHVKSVLLVGLPLADVGVDGDACVPVNVESQGNDAVTSFAGL